MATFIDRKSAPEGEDLKLEATVNEALAMYEWSHVESMTPTIVFDHFATAENFARYVRVALKFVPQALRRLQRLRDHNLMLRQTLFAVKKTLTQDAGSCRCGTCLNNREIAGMIERVLNIEAPL